MAGPALTFSQIQLFREGSVWPDNGRFVSVYFLLTARVTAQ